MRWQAGGEQWAVESERGENNGQGRRKHLLPPAPFQGLKQREFRTRISLRRVEEGGREKIGMMLEKVRCDLKVRYRGNWAVAEKIVAPCGRARGIFTCKNKGNLLLKNVHVVDYGH